MSFHKFSPTENTRRKTSTLELLATTTKTHKIDNSTPVTPKKKNPHTIPTITTKRIITETINHWSLVSLNTNGLNSSIKRHRLPDWIRKQNPPLCSM